jgi:hypothetical protein
MVINHQRRWIYLGPPKTGSTTLTYLLTDGDDFRRSAAPRDLRVFGGMKHAGQHCMDIPRECASYFTFVSIRNPYSRAVSLWWHWNCESRRLDRPRLTFDQFLVRLLDSQADPASNALAGGDFYHFTLSRWLRWVPRLDRIIRQEQLEGDLNELNLAAPITLPQINRSPAHRLGDGSLEKRGNWRDYLTSETASHVVAWAKDDFERFGYATEVPEYDPSC